MKEVEGSANSRFLFRRYEILGGTVKVDGTNISTITQNSLRVMIGVVLQAMQKSICEMIRVVPQSYEFVEQHPLTNITFGKRDTVDSELNKVVLSAQFIVDIICLLPEGWDILVGDSRLELSRAKKGRIVFLLKDSPVVVFERQLPYWALSLRIPLNRFLKRFRQEHRVLVTGDRMTRLLLYWIQSLRIVFNRHLLCLDRNILVQTSNTE
ncbi:hypothetical protein CTEN210_08548 [Chaetoceros tenuissimus]|uniref:Uncharacterized protein n=1 Tax=Chaetoceros tenuissimus TaxID=426638 RepID=A0AAD3CU15_9STRA|nr:hypothetical protein CTEN210_08548 [Chaetoceros tenuissimus]